MTEEYHIQIQIHSHPNSMTWTVDVDLFNDGHEKFVFEKERQQFNYIWILVTKHFETFRVDEIMNITVLKITSAIWLLVVNS